MTILPLPEPVARTMRYIGKDDYAKKHGNCARTYDELPDGMYPESWEKTGELFTTAQLRQAQIDALEEAAKLCDQADKSTHPADLADRIRNMAKELK